jgi:hypothetical protein
VRTKRTMRTKSCRDRMVRQKNAQKELKELKAPSSCASLPIISALAHDFDRQHFHYLWIYETSSTEQVDCFRLHLVSPVTNGTMSLSMRYRVANVPRHQASGW